MGYTQYLDLAREHRSLVLIGLSSGVTYRPFIFSLSLDSSLFSLSSLYIYEIAVYNIIRLLRDIKINSLFTALSLPLLFTSYDVTDALLTTDEWTRFKKRELTRWSNKRITINYEHDTIKAIEPIYTEILIKSIERTSVYKLSVSFKVYNGV